MKQNKIKSQKNTIKTKIKQKETNTNIYKGGLNSSRD